MLHGMRQAAKPPTSEHPFGHGLQLYFWTFIVAILIFGLGAGIALVEGINKILVPHPLESPAENYAVLAVSAVFEGFTWFVALGSSAGEKGVADGWMPSGPARTPLCSPCCSRTWLPCWACCSGSRTSRRAGIESASNGRSCLGRHRSPALRSPLVSLPTRARACLPAKVFSLTSGQASVSGWRVSPYRARRLPRTASTRLASTMLSNAIRAIG